MAMAGPLDPVRPRELPAACGLINVQAACSIWAEASSHA